MQMTIVNFSRRVRMLSAFMIMGVLPLLRIPCQAQTPPCAVAQIPIEISLAGVPLRMTDGHFSSSAEGPSYADFVVTNVSSLPIEEASFVLDYLDQSGNSLGKISFVESQRRAKNPWHIHAEHRGDSFARSLDVGATRLINGTSSSLLSGCPTRARLIFLGVSFSDNTTQSWALPNWNLGPILNYFSSSFEIRPLGSTNTATILRMQVKIDERGQVFQLDPLSGTKVEDVRELFPQITKWSFFPHSRTAFRLGHRLLLRSSFCRARRHTSPPLWILQQIPSFSLRRYPMNRNLIAGGCSASGEPETRPWSKIQFWAARPLSPVDGRVFHVIQANGLGMFG